MMARLGVVALLFVGVAACSKSTSKSPPVERPSDDEVDEGELRAGAVGAHRIGTPGPAMTMKTLDGDTIDLAKLYGSKPVYLKFWATWCVPCREQMPKFERIYQSRGDSMHVIAVNAGLNDEVSAVRAFREKHDLHMPIVVDDGSLAAALGLQVTPQHVLVGRDGRIAYVGHLDGAKLDEAIEAVLTQPGSNVATAQPVAVPPAFRIGDQVRGLFGKRTDGTTVDLGATGRPRALVLFADWCESYLQETLPKTSQDCRRVREDVDRLAARGDVDWLGIATGLWSSAESVDAYKAKNKTSLPLVLDSDGALFRAFGVREMPTIVLLDSNGRVARVLGPNDRDLEAAVRTLTN